MRRRGAVAALGLVLAGWPLAAVGQTVISPDVAAGRALGTTVGQNGTTYAIDGGTRAGNNLFHSFSRFDLAAGDTARWVRSAGDGGAIANVVNRVTGGQVSTIAGMIDSTALPNADFYFINPAGVVFGAGAVLNVPAAAHFSTAAELRFANGDRFAIATPNGATLSVAAPEAFGFVGGQGAIDFASVGVAFVPGYTPLSFTASDITVTASQFAAGGLDMVAVGDGTALVRIADPLAGAYAGTIEMRNSTLNAAAVDTPGGPFRLGAGLINLEAGRLVTDTAGAALGADLILDADRIRVGADSYLITSARGAGAAGRVDVTAGELLIDATGSTTTTGVTSVSSAAGAAGVIRLTADTIRLQGGAFVGSTVTGSGDAGDVSMTAKSLVIDSGLISSSTLGAGDGGDMRLRADTFRFNAATMVTGAFSTGVAGDVFLDGGSLLMTGGTLGSTPGGVGDSGNVFIDLTGRLETIGASFSVSTFNDFGAAIAAGNIGIRASELVMRQSSIFTQATGRGRPGQVQIETGAVTFDDVFLIGDAKDGVGQGAFRLRATGDIVMRDVFFTSTANGAAVGGAIEIRGRNIDLIGSFVLSDANTNSTGDAGSVLVAATGRLGLAEQSLISSSTSSAGNAGDVRVEAGAITLESGSGLRSDALDSSSGDAGAVSVFASRLTLATAASISSTTNGPGAGGAVTIQGDEIYLAGESAGLTSILAETFGEGRGGNVSIVANKLTLDNAALISSVSRFDADAGGIVLDVGELSVLSGSAIATVALGAGKSGDIEILADKLQVISDNAVAVSSITSAGVRGGGGNIRLDAGSLLIDLGQISSDSIETGDAGNVDIAADEIVLRTFGAISSNTQGLGNAGAIAVQAGTLTLEQGTTIISAATPKSTGGNAGSVTVAADDIVIGEDASINTSTSSVGDAGRVFVQATSLRVDGGFISSSAEIGATGQARDVTIVADDLAVVNRGSIDTLSTNANPAGTVNILAGSLLVDGLGSVVGSENIAGDPAFDLTGPGGNAGTIQIAADSLTISNGGRISTNSFAGAAGDIAVSIDRPGLFVLQGGEFPGVIQTSSGPGTGGKITITDPLAIVSNGGRILALGQQRGANVVIDSRYFIESTDRLNVVDVAGEVQIQSDLYDVSAGTVSRDLSVLDASRVLRGQCPAARATGAVSQLITRPVGPYARDGAMDLLRAQPPAGGC